MVPASWLTIRRLIGRQMVLLETFIFIIETGASIGRAAFAGASLPATVDGTQVGWGEVPLTVKGGSYYKAGPDNQSKYVCALVYY